MVSLVASMICKYKVTEIWQTPYSMAKILWCFLFA